MSYNRAAFRYLLTRVHWRYTQTDVWARTAIKKEVDLPFLWTDGAAQDTWLVTHMYIYLLLNCDHISSSRTFHMLLFLAVNSLPSAEAINTRVSKLNTINSSLSLDVVLTSAFTGCLSAYWLLIGTWTLKYASIVMLPLGRLENSLVHFYQ